MPETIVIKGEHGLPYSKGLMAQSLSASGLAPDRAYELAGELEGRLDERPEGEIAVDALRDLAAVVLREREGDDAARVGITRVIATDAVRNVIRAFFSHDFMPVVHYSSFEAGSTVDPAEVGDGDPDVVGYLRQVASVRTGVLAIAERAIQEGTPLILEGVHLLPGS